MNIHTCNMSNTVLVLAACHVDFEAQYLPSEQTYLVSLAPSTKWQDLVAISTKLGPSEFDFATNTLYLED